MATEFDLTFDEFSAELDALVEMAGIAGAGAAAGSPRARVAAGNGAVLLLAAVFEEHVRQQVRAAFREKTRNAADLSEFPAKIAAVVWKRSMETLARTPFEEIESRFRATDDVVSATIAFCLRKEVTPTLVALYHTTKTICVAESSIVFSIK